MNSVAIVGAEKEVIELVQSQPNLNLYGVFDPNPNADILSVKYLGNDSKWLEFKNKESNLNVIIALDISALKEKLTQHYGLENLLSIISDTAYISPSANIGTGAIIQRDVCILASVNIGICCKINTRTQIHHDCKVGDYCTIAPTCTLLGKVIIEDSVFIGAGTIILPGVRIGYGATIGAGAVVTKDIPPKTTFVGVPARKIK